ncbi:MAG: GH1 family beta-glucosidase [Melioribacteraceae bacterium]
MFKFPKDFVWGTSTSAYQIEGAWLDGGKGLSIWDVFSHTPGKTLNGDNADVACDHYNRLEEDVQLLKNLGVTAYRFSIAWTRIQPTGYGERNKEGVEFYSKLIDLLLENNIDPWVTLYHWDLPATLDMEKDGWLNPNSADYFAEYARICFEEFGDRVTKWTTFNEPWVTTILGYGFGNFAPGRTSNTEPYIVAHNLLRSHGKAAKIYHEEFQSTQKGIIGVCNNCDWREPKTNSEADKEAAERALEFYLGWFADPLYKGEYPKSMRENVGDRLPKFTEEDSAMIKGSCDFFGLNHYTTMLTENDDRENIKNDADGFGGMDEDEKIILSSDESWGKKTTMGWNIVPWGLTKLLKWIDERYDNPEIYITENGAGFDDKFIDGKINDVERIKFLDSYIKATTVAIDSGVNVKGYFVWSLLDNFEWASGYSQRFGMHHVDFKTLKRTPKESAKWYRDLIKKNEI